MSSNETVQNGQNATESDADTEPGTESQDASESGSETGSGTENEAEAFSRSYVEALRAENGKHRTRAKSLSEKLISAYAAQTGRLHDPTDLAATDDLLGEDGVPDPERIKDAVEGLIKAKPHLARIRPVGNVGQGSTTEGTTDGAGAFASMLRGVAS